MGNAGNAFLMSDQEPLHQRRRLVFLTSKWGYEYYFPVKAIDRWLTDMEVETFLDKGD
ncbi:hypothetical protein [Rossellomorea sp. YZS02]|uniref:hypothetical protein n=1 Tax=Rossellomorea sp. YZS02 TaxID=3097358 RepID=UPI002A143090|nr:hypothetical protein [Rossellomorea sp. YZS02]MDX8342213.1 hypothetical protein [Rossellomorea sp. YZS02]